MGIGDTNVTPEQWASLVWHYVACQDERTRPNAAAAARLTGVEHRVALKAWDSGYLAHGGVSIKKIRAEVSTGRRPFPDRPLGAPAPTSKIARKALSLPNAPKFTAREAIAQNPGPRPVPPPKRAPLPRPTPPPVAAPPPAPSPQAPFPPAAPPAPPPDDDADIWGGESADGDMFASLGSVAFPDDPTPSPGDVVDTSQLPDPFPLPPKAPRRPQFRDARQTALQQAERDRFDDAPDLGPPPPQVDIPSPADYRPLPSETTSPGTGPAPIDRAFGDRVLLEARHDLIDIGARSRRSAALAVWATQAILAGVVPLAERMRDELKALAKQTPEDGVEWDVEGALKLTERAMRVARAAAGLSTGATSQAKAITAEIALHLRTTEAQPDGSAADDLTDEELVARAEDVQERLAREAARTRRRLEEQEAGTGPSSGDGAAPGAPEAPAEPPVPPAVTLASVLTELALRALVDEDTWRRGEEYARDGRVVRMSEEESGLAGEVQGELSYATRLAPVEGALGATCTCPQGQLGRPCKHAVALGLVWLWSRSAPAEGGTPGQGAETPLERQEEPPAGESEEPGEVGDGDGEQGELT